MAPAYDICHAYRPNSEWVSQQALSINGIRKNITKDDFIQVSQSLRIKKAENIIEEINEKVGKWKVFANETGVSNKIKNAISETLIYLK